MTTNAIHRVAAGSALLVAGGAMTCCRSEAMPGTPPRVVETMVVTAASGGTEGVYSGQVVSRYKEQYAFRVSGMIAAKLVEVGQPVVARQALARLDPADVALNVRSADAQVAAASAHAVQQAADLRRSRQLAREGIISPAEFDRQQAAATQANAQLLSTEAQRAGTARYRELTGLDAVALRPVRGDILPREPMQPVGDWQTRAEGTFPALLALRGQFDAARAKIDRYGWEAQAKVMAVGLYGRSWRTGANDASTKSAIRYPGHVEAGFAGQQLRMPLYTGGALESQRRQAAAQARGAEQKVEAARRGLRLQVHQAWLGQRSGAEQVLALCTGLASAELQEKAALTGREVGVRTQSDVIAAQAQVFYARRQLGGAIRNYELARLQLHAVASSLSVETLAEVNADLATQL